MIDPTKVELIHPKLIGNPVRRKRVLSGTTMRELADILDLSVSTISRVERYKPCDAIAYYKLLVWLNLENKK